MAVYLCRWPNGDFSIVMADSRREAIIELDWWGKTQIGLWSSLSSNYTVEVIAGAGFDWILLDSEHSPNDLESLRYGITQVGYPCVIKPLALAGSRGVIRANDADELIAALTAAGIQTAVQVGEVTEDPYGITVV